jgi:hypothetical protein
VQGGAAFGILMLVKITERVWSGPGRPHAPRAGLAGLCPVAHWGDAGGALLTHGKPSPGSGVHCSHRHRHTRGCKRYQVACACEAVPFHSGKFSCGLRSRLCMVAALVRLDDEWQEAARLASLSPPATGSLMLRHRRPPPHTRRRAALQPRRPPTLVCHHAYGCGQGTYGSAKAAGGRT